MKLLQSLQEEHGVEKTAEKSGNPVTLKLCGRIDAGNSERVKQELFSELTDKEPDSVILDAEDLSHVSNAGLRIFLQMLKICPDISMINVRPEVYEVLERYQLSPLKASTEDLIMANF